MSKKLKVVFTEDFATKKKGEVCEFGYSLAMTLVRVNKVAELQTEEAELQTEETKVKAKK